MGFEPIYDRPYEDRELPGYSIPRRLFYGAEGIRIPNLHIDNVLRYQLRHDSIIVHGGEESNLQPSRLDRVALPFLLSYPRMYLRITAFVVYAPVQAEVRPAFAVGLVFWHVQTH